MRIVVTGASGFVGGAVLRGLSKLGFDCIGVSRRISPGLVRVREYSETPEADCLIHCAETNDRSVANSLFESEARRTLSLLLAKRYNQVVYMSSAVLYGDQGMAPRKVSDPIKVVDTYTRIKQDSERVVLEKGGAIVRLANLYGYGMASNNVVSHILAQLGNGDSITMRSLNPVRDFLWIDDAAEAVHEIVQRGAEGIFNVGSGRGSAIREVVDIAQLVHGSRQQVISSSIPETFSRLVLDIASTQRDLGWTPKVNLEEGIRRLVNMKLVG